MATVEAKKLTGNKTELYWLGAILAVGLVMYADTFVDVWQKWNENAQYSLAYLAPIVVGVFTYLKWPEVKKVERAPSNWGLALIAGALVLHSLGLVLDISGPSSVSVVIALIGGLIYFHSVDVVKVLWFPLAYTVFMIPVPGGVLDLVAAPLQLASSAATEVILKAIGMEVARDGVYMWVPGFDFQVAEGCSGLSSLVALTGVTAVFAYMTRLPNGYKWLLFLLAVPVAFLANVFRITTIALVGYQWGEDLATKYHDSSSPVLFMAAIGILFLINWGLEWVSGRRKITA